MQIKPTSPISPPGRSVPVNQKQASAPQAEVQTQRALAQVISQESGIAQVKTLPGGQILELQTGQQLRAGQLVVLEQQAGQIKLDTQPKAIVEQLLRHLLPHSGGLKSALLSVITTALSGNTALSGQTALSGNTALSGQTALSGYTALKGTSAPTGSTTQNQNPSLSPNVVPGNSATSSGLTSPGIPAGTRPSGLNQYLGINQLLPTNSTPTAPASLQSQLLPLLGNALGNAGPNSTGHPDAKLNLLSQVAQMLTANPKQPINQPLAELINGLPQTQSLREPGQIAALLQPNAQSPLVKLMLPLLKSVLLTPPLNNTEQEKRQELLPRLNQLLARGLLSGIRAPGAGPEAELGRGEWLSRHDNAIDNLQFQLGVVRERNPEEDQNQTHGKEAQGQVRRWTVRLAFDFEELGLITAYVVLVDNRALEMNFWAERPTTKQKLEAYQQKFHKKVQQVLSEHGIERLAIDVLDGDPPSSKPQVTTQLVNEIA